MNRKELSRQLSDLPEEMIAEAMAPAKRLQRKYTALRVLRMAACLAVAVGLLLGLSALYSGENGTPASPLVITAFAAGGADTVLLSSATQSPDWAPNISSIPGLPFSLSVDSQQYDPDQVHFRISADDGNLCRGEYGSTQVIQGTYQQYTANEPVRNNTILYWDPMGENGYAAVQHTYINILVYENENIIGYAVLLITNQDISQESAGVFTLSLAANEAFSKEAQESGQITQEYVQGLMQQWKKPNGDGIITGPGILEITVHAIDVQTHKIIREKLTENDFITNRNYWSLTMNSIPGLPVHLTIPAEQGLYDDLSFHISVNCGRYLTEDSQSYIQILGSDFTAKKDSLIFWEPSGTDYYENDAYDHVYTNIVIYSGEHIVGYAILHFERIYCDEMKTLVSPGLADRYEGRDNEPTSAYHMEVLKSVSFPKVDGKYQNISMSYVNSCMQAVIDGQ